ncbi:MAG TPA: hypothetical protein PLQ69_08445, partial [Paludibacter sp.]|nr:hypothetical protein [Paludibacter sp.]
FGTSRLVTIMIVPTLRTFFHSARPLGEIAFKSANFRVIFSKDTPVKDQDKTRDHDHVGKILTKTMDEGHAVQNG